MGCGSSKSSDATAAQQSSSTSAKPAGSAAPAAKPAAAAPAAGRPGQAGAATDAEEEDDPLLAKELNAKKVDKKGNEVDMYARAEARPEDNAGFGMFQMESAGSGDQALAVKPWVGQIQQPTNAPAFDNQPPSVNLDLEYIYGYRCFDTRQNVFYTNAANKIVYMAAAVGITLNTSTNVQEFFGAGLLENARGHSEDITALAIHPNKTLVATGEVGSNPKIIIWDTSSMQKVQEMKQGRGSRGVSSLAFNKDGTLLASTALDNDHTVRIWNTSNGNKVEEQKGGPDRILDCAFSPTENMLVTVGVKQHVYFWNGAKSWEKKRGIMGKTGKDTKCMTVAGFLQDGTAVTGGSNGHIYLYSGNECKSCVNVHGGKSIHTLRCIGNEILSGGSDNKIRVLDATGKQTGEHAVPATPRAVDKNGNNLIVGCINGDIVELAGGQQKKVMESHSDGEVWALAPVPGNPNQVVTAGDDNKVKVWDTAQKKCTATAEINGPGGAQRKSGYGASTLADTNTNQQVRAIDVHPTNGQIAMGLNDGCVQVRASAAQLTQKTKEMKDAKEWIEALRFSPCGKWLAVGSHDQFIYIYNTSGYALASKIQKSSSYITALDWSCDSTAIHTTDGSYELLYYSVDASGKIQQNPSGATEYKDEKWATFSTVFGWPVQGIFEGNIDYTHVNRVERSPDDRFFAVGNDYGLVALFNNPNGEGAKAKSYRAHSEHVTNVKWTNTHVFSAGGYDQCIMQWRKSG